MEAIGVLVLIGFFAYAIVAGQNEKKQREATLRALREPLGGGRDETSVWGELAGTHVVLRYTSRGSGKSRTAWTEVDAEIPAKYPLAFFVQKHGWSDSRKIEAGEMVDVIVGDPSFDQAFRVEAAPADVARVLLHDRAREYLLRLVDTLWFEITTERTNPDKPVLRLAIRSHLLDLTAAMAAIEAITSIASKVRDAYIAVQDAAEIDDKGSPYRPMLDDTRARASAVARLEEVEKVERVRIDRAARGQLIAVAVIVGFVVLYIVLLAAS